MPLFRSADDVSADLLAEPQRTQVENKDVDPTRDRLFVDLHSAGSL
jgi:hypothetical protein